MPANRTSNIPWVQKPDFFRDRQLAAQPDERVVDFNNVEQVADCLVDNDELAVYAFVENVDVRALALESARDIIESRNRLHAEREMQQAPTPVRTISVPSVRDAVTGQRLPSRAIVVENRRSFG